MTKEKYSEEEIRKAEEKGDSVSVFNMRSYNISVDIEKMGC